VSFARSGGILTPGPQRSDRHPFLLPQKQKLRFRITEPEHKQNPNDAKRTTYNRKLCLSFYADVPLTSIEFPLSPIALVEVTT
jgi:hypothetical protein